MVLSSCIFSTRISVAYRIDCPRLAHSASNNNIFGRKHGNATQIMKSEFAGSKVNHIPGFVGWARISNYPNPGRNSPHRRRSVVYATCTQIASGAFTLGTVAVLPFYTAMIVAPKSEFTKTLMGSSIPYIALGLLYAYLLYLSWTPETFRLMFASQYWLPELPGIARMFSNEVTLASAWIHLLAVDLFAARQVYFDGLKNNMEVRHSISLCLLFCPIGVLVHFITKALAQAPTPSKGGGKREAGIVDKHHGEERN